MIVHQVFAHIKGQEIKNIIVCDNYELANQLARMIFGDDAMAVNCNQYPVSIGDKYIDGYFYYKNGTTKVEYKNTAEQDAAIANAKAKSLEADNITLMEAIADLYEASLEA